MPRDQDPSDVADENSSADDPTPHTTPSRSSVGEVAREFSRLGVTSFGGPVAHLGYFRTAFVERLRWLSDRAYADLVALCQFLPGPASSQVGMAVGLSRAGYRGMAVAWAGFTLPSVIALVLFAYAVDSLGDISSSGWIAGLKAVAVAVVAHALLGMVKNLAADRERATIAAGAMIFALLVPGSFGQVGAILAAGAIGVVWLRATSADPDAHLPLPVRPSVGIVSLLLFFGLLVGLPMLVTLTSNDGLRLFDVFYRSGALVFGGGHVVLPLLQAEMVETGMIGMEEFLAGYGAAQAVPGPLFTFAGYLGTLNTTGPDGILGATIATFGIFLPATLLVLGVAPFWNRVRHIPTIRRALLGINAGVVGILAAALYDPVFTSGITGPIAMAIAAAAFVALQSWKVAPWIVVVLGALAGWAFL